jgi:hypothetical protein
MDIGLMLLNQCQIRRSAPVTVRQLLPKGMKPARCSQGLVHEETAVPKKTRQRAKIVDYLSQNGFQGSARSASHSMAPCESAKPASAHRAVPGLISFTEQSNLVSLKRASFSAHEVPQSAYA